MSIRKLISIMALFVSITALGAGKNWEEVDRLPGPPVEQRIDHNADGAVTVADGYVYVIVRERTNVKIFTILGQLIVQDNLQPGIYRYKLSARGIYLLKVGSITRRVTL